MPTFSTRGAVLAYDESGERDRPPIVFLHGLSMSKSNWGRVTPAFRSDHHVFALDHRGHGDSSRAPGTYVLADYGDDTIAFCDEIVKAPAVLVGHSLGGVIAFSVARRRPDLVRGVFLEDPPLYKGEPDSPDAAGLAAFFPLLRQILTDVQQGDAPVEQFNALLRGVPALNGNGTFEDAIGAESLSSYADAWAKLDPETLTAAIDGAALRGAEADSTLKCPAVVLRADSLGAAFTEADARRFLVGNPDVAVKMIDGTSHLIHDEQTDRFIEELRGFIASLDRN